MLFTQAPAVETLSYGWLFAKTIIIMVVIIVLAFLCIKYLLPRLVKLRRRTASDIEVLDFQPLEQKKSIYVVKIQDKKLAVGVSDHSVTKLCEWDAPENGDPS